MAQTLETLTRQTASMESIHSVVHTMKTLSVINSAPYEQAARAIEDYHATVLDGLHAFVSASGAWEMATAAPALRVVVVFGSDHGLCGNYNERVAGHVAAHLAGSHGATRILCVGAQMADALADRALCVEDTFLPPASVDGLGRLANLLTRRLDVARQSAGYRDIAVDLAFAARAEGHGQEPRIDRLLPLDAALVQEMRGKPWRSRSLPSYSMPARDLFRALLRAHVFASLVRAAAEAMVTENAARMALMQQAEQSVEDRLEALKSDANTLRQSGITSELLDVIIGFEALKGRRKTM
jgi:F-type H+-transporting ATPase subunit gamma